LTLYGQIFVGFNVVFTFADVFSCVQPVRSATTLTNSTAAVRSSQTLVKPNFHHYETVITELNGRTTGLEFKSLQPTARLRQSRNTARSPTLTVKLWFHMSDTGPRAARCIELCR